MTLAIESEATIGGIAAKYPRSLGVFERFHLDFCCHGERTLRQACEAAGATFEDVVRALRELPASADGDARDWTVATMTELADHIEATHHAFAREAFDRLAVLAPKVARHHGAAHPELFEIERVVNRLREEMLDHMIREDRVLFPWLRRLESKASILSGPPWSVKRPIDCMMHDHEEVGRMLESIRALTNGFSVPPGACGSYQAMIGLLRDLEADTHVHIHKENSILFPAGIKAEAASGRRGGQCRDANELKESSETVPGRRAEEWAARDGSDRGSCGC